MRVELHTDSKYCVNGLKEWMPKWLAKTGGMSKVENSDLWLILWSLMLQREGRQQRYM